MNGEIDFGLLRQPDYAGNALTYFDAGQKQHTQRERQNALLMANSNPVQSMAKLRELGDFEAEGSVRADYQRKRRGEIATQYGTDPKGAADAARADGDFEMEKYLSGRTEEQRAEDARKLEAGARVYASLLPLPQDQRAPHLVSQGVAPEAVGKLDLSDAGIRSEIAKGMTAKEQIELYKPSWQTTKRADGSTYNQDMNQWNWRGGGDGPVSESGTVPSTRQASAAGGDQHGPVFDALIQQESHGRAGVLGPQTDYGRAEGMTQMLPATAQSMAQKLGVPWRPDLMRASTPEGADYQRKLGRAYFDEGLEKYGGDVNKALMYYHGGPNEQLWGPKTHRYAQEVQARVQPSSAPSGGPVQPYQLASNGPTPPPPAPPTQAQVAAAQQGRGPVSYGPGGIPTMQGDAAPEPEWVPDGHGALKNRNGDTKKDDAYIERGNVLPPQLGLTSLGGNFYQDRVGKTYERDKAGNMKQTVGVTDQAVAKASEGMVAANTLMQAADQFNQAIVALKPGDFGPKGEYLGDPVTYARAKAAATNLMMNLKGEAGYNLGVLAGPDLEVLSGVVMDPAKLKTAIQQGQILPKIGQLSNSIGFKVRSLREGFRSQGGNPSGLPAFYADTIRAERQAKQQRGQQAAQAAPGQQAPGANAPAQKRPPPGAIDMLRSNPALAERFDAKYGKGAARSVLGR